MRRLRFQLLIFLAALAGVNSIASETDAFTFRYAPIADSSEVVSAEINHRIESVLKRIEDRGCDEQLLFKRLSRKLRFPVYGKIENWIMRHPRLVPHAREKVKDSVYKNIKFKEAFPIYLGKMGFGPVLRVNGQLIGNDKMGHFLDEGFHYFDLVVRQKKSISEALSYGTETENGIYGIKQTGVHSFADTVANFNGMNFWARILGKPVWGSGDSYIVCEDGKYVQKTKFTLNDYVDAAWDEGVNCNDYRNDQYRDRVFSVIAQLEERDHKPYACPVAPPSCAEMALKYGDYADILLHPTCRTAAKMHAKNP